MAHLLVSLISEFHSSELIEVTKAAGIPGRRRWRRKKRRKCRCGLVLQWKKLVKGDCWESPPGGRLCPGAGWEERRVTPVWSAELR